VNDADEQVVREAFARWNRGDHAVDPELIDPEITILSALAQAEFHGYEGAEAWVREIDEQFADWRVEVDELRDAGGGRFVLEGAIHGRGRQSGVDVDEDASWLAEVRGGRLLRLDNFIGRDTAGEALAREG
jgi:ketosteroid isomerase-like protein